MCAHLLDDGWKEPRCVDACPTEALRFGEEADLEEYIKQAEVLHPEYKARPRVYYIGLPNKYFVAGAVYDPEEDECLEGVTVTLKGARGKKVATLKTDNFGDFWFERLPAGTYSLLIEKTGYLPRKVEAIDASKDVNVGDLELYKQVA
jgi:tetrathionate reductase subunit B